MNVTLSDGVLLAGEMTSRRGVSHGACIGPEEADNLNRGREGDRRSLMTRTSSQGCGLVCFVVYLGVISAFSHYMLAVALGR